MLGLVPAFIPSVVLLTLYGEGEYVYSSPEFAWNATSNPPPGVVTMLGLVPAFIPSVVSTTLYGEVE